MNGRDMRRLGVSRRQLFESVERPALQSLPEQRLRVCRVASRPRRDRLSRRGPGLLLLGAARADPRAGGHPRHRAHDRGVPSRQARRRPSRGATAARGTAPCPSTCRAHTGATPNGRRSACSVRRDDRPEHRGADHRRARPPAASRTGLSHLPRRAAPVPRHRAGASRGGQPARVEIGALTYASPRSSNNDLEIARRKPRTARRSLHDNIRGSRYYH